MEIGFIRCALDACFLFEYELFKFSLLFVFIMLCFIHYTSAAKNYSFAAEPFNSEIYSYLWNYSIGSPCMTKALSNPCNVFCKRSSLQPLMITLLLYSLNFLAMASPIPALPLLINTAFSCYFYFITF
jgi:hypothetical protein